MLYGQISGFEFPAAFYVALRVVVGIGVGLVAWFLAGPILAILHRAFLRKEISRSGESAGRLLVGASLGFLAFLLVHFGSGGSGWGFGGGSGTGTGTGTPNGTGQSTPNKSGSGTGDIKTPIPQPGEKKELFITLVAVDSDDADQQRFYLIGQDAEARSINEVASFLTKTKGKWTQMTIILYKDSFNKYEYPVKNLQQYAESHGMGSSIPPEYYKMERPKKTS